MKTKNKLFNDLIVGSLFSDKGTLTEKDLTDLGTCKYDLGKYRPETKVNNPDIDIPVWYELKSDRDGKYLQIMTFNYNSDKVINIWKKLNKGVNQ